MGTFTSLSARPIKRVDGLVKRLIIRVEIGPWIGRGFPGNQKRRVQANHSKFKSLLLLLILLLY